MSKRSVAARHLRRRLEMETAVGVDVVWDKWPGNSGWSWLVCWSDGPTVPAMRAIAERALRDIGGIDADAARYARMLSQRAIALAMIRQVRLGRPPLGCHHDLSAFLDSLDAESYPEQSSDEDLAAAERLARRCDWLDWRMAEILTRDGLAAIGERPLADPPGSNVIPINSRRPWRRT